MTVAMVMDDWHDRVSPMLDWIKESTNVLAMKGKDAFFLLTFDDLARRSDGLDFHSTNGGRGREILYKHRIDIFRIWGLGFDDHSDGIKWSSNPVVVMKWQLNYARGIVLSTHTRSEALAWIASGRAGGELTVRGQIFGRLAEKQAAALVEARERTQLEFDMLPALQPDRAESRLVISPGRKPAKSHAVRAIVKGSSTRSVRCPRCKKLVGLVATETMVRCTIIPPGGAARGIAVRCSYCNDGTLVDVEVL